VDKNFLTKQWYKKITHALIGLILYSLLYILFFPPVILSEKGGHPSDLTWETRGNKMKVDHAQAG